MLKRFSSGYLQIEITTHKELRSVLSTPFLNCFLKSLMMVVHPIRLPTILLVLEV
nr:MAG TPA: hypothetical protein [Caudoviricetes sp.]